MAIVFQNKQTGRLCIPDIWMDKEQKALLKKMKEEGVEVDELEGRDWYERRTTYNPETKFKTRFRKGDDGVIDMIIGASVVDEINTGSLPKASYRVLRFTPTKPNALLSSSKGDYSLVVVASTEIVTSFHFDMPLEEVTEHLEASIKKGVDYFGN